MDKRDLINTLSKTFFPLGFKKKGNYWVFNDTEINKIVNLQKSQFGNSYYINYGFILNSIPLDNLSMHIFKVLGSLNQSENEEIKKILNLDSNVSDEIRENILSRFLNAQIIETFNKVNNEEEFLDYLKSLESTFFSTIPLIVKKHFSLV